VGEEIESPEEVVGEPASADAPADGPDEEN
jgi:hypothetical protein